MDKRLLSMLSLCRRAGGMKTGSFACEKAIQGGKALLVLVGMDASENTKKRFSQKAFYYGVPYRELLSREELGRAVGLEETAAVVITDSNFSGRILELIEL